MRRGSWRAWMPKEGGREGRKEEVTGAVSHTPTLFLLASFRHVREEGADEGGLGRSVLDR